MRLNTNRQKTMTREYSTKSLKSKPSEEKLNTIRKELKDIYNARKTFKKEVQLRRCLSIKNY